MTRLLTSNSFRPCITVHQNTYYTLLDIDATRALDTSGSHTVVGISLSCIMWLHWITSLHRIALRTTLDLTWPSRIFAWTTLYFIGRLLPWYNHTDLCRQPETKPDHLWSIVIPEGQLERGRKVPLTPSLPSLSSSPLPHDSRNMESRPFFELICYLVHF